MPPTLGIIVPVFREHAALAQRLASLQTLPCDELLFVDGGSDDGTVGILQQAGMRVLLADKGRARQMNAGAAACHSEWLLFLHADTLISSKALRAMRQAITHPRCVGGRFDVVLDHPAPVFRLIAFMINWRSRLSKIATGDQAIFVRRDVFMACGGFPALPLMEDVAFSRRLKHYAAQHHGHIACLRHRVITSARRWQQHGVMRTIWLMWKLRLLFWLGVDAGKLAAMYRDAR